MFKLPVLASITTVLLATLPLPGLTLPLSPGDRVRVSIPADEAVQVPEMPATYRFSGVYEVDLDGKIYLPLIEPIAAAGLEPNQVNQAIRNALIQGGYFRADFLQLTTSVVQWAPIQVHVAGATFLPGRILVDDSPPVETAAIQHEQQAQQRPEPFTVSGNYPPGRYLTAALRLAGGIQPNADIKNVRIVRGSQEQVIDLSGAFTGERFEDIPLIAGDQIIVPQLPSIQNNIVRPSQITPSAIAVYVSNQTAPTNFGGEVSQFPYGSRFSQAVVAARCAGGTRSTNANRRVTLVQTDRLSGQTKVYDQKVEDLLRHPDDNDINPFLMPQDSVVCYDSTVTNASGVLDFIGTVLNPFRALRSIFFGD